MFALYRMFFKRSCCTILPHGLELLLVVLQSRRVWCLLSPAGLERTVQLLFGSRSDAHMLMTHSSQVARPMYSNPPLHGALIAAKVLGDKALFEEWKVWSEILEVCFGNIESTLQQAAFGFGFGGTCAH